MKVPLIFPLFLPPMSTAFASEHFRLGILGGGQLGRMLIQECINLNVSTHVMDPDSHAPCRHLCDRFTHGDLMSDEDVYRFGKECSLLTVEIEHVNTHALERLESEGIPVYPQPQLLRLVQDKGLQKQFFVNHGIPTSSFTLVNGREELLKMEGHLPAMLKLRKGGYDGKGVMKLRHADEATGAFDAPCVVEELVDIRCEVSVIVARNIHGEISHFPPVDMEFNPEVNLVEFLCSPARIPDETADKAISIARLVIEKMGMVGLLAVEMFVTTHGDVLVNEIAPRPHNSGHQTIEGNVTSQYAQHLRAILGLPSGDTSCVRPAVMINLLGEPGHTGEAHYLGIDRVMDMPGVYVHLYGKKTTKPFRKMGHVTVTAVSLDEAIARARQVQGILKVVTHLS
jgi:5-(carboxyamino)imidazole ribonucleotide synthase